MSHRAVPLDMCTSQVCVPLGAVFLRVLYLASVSDSLGFVPLHMCISQMWIPGGLS